MQEARFVEEYFNQTTVHPAGVLGLAVLGVAMLFLPRRHAILPMLLLLSFIAPGQRLVLLTLDFNFLRLIILVAWVRIITRREWEGVQWGAMDLCIGLWGVVTGVLYSLNWGTGEAVIRQLGEYSEALGGYYALRCFLRTGEDLIVMVKGLALISIPVAAAFVVEHLTGRNVFAVLGGVPEITMEREGRLRCQGAFPHPILAGCFWAAVLPLVASLGWHRRRDRVLSVVACGSCVLIVALTASSTPLVALLVGIVAMMAFSVRRWLGVGMITALCGVLAVQVVMTRPVWFLIAHIGPVEGSTSYHRAALIDGAARHFREWWLLGTQSTAHWGPGLYDVTNHYIIQCVRGGVASFLLFVFLLGLAFRAVSRGLRSVEEDDGTIHLKWAVGAMLLVHCISFLAVSYFAQMQFIFYVTLAMCAAIGSSELESGRSVKLHRTQSTTCMMPAN